MTDDYPANQQEATADLFQWVFSLPQLKKLAGRRISARFLASALQDLSTASHGDNANEVRLAWQMVLDTLGPIMLSHFLHHEAWKQFCPEPDHDQGTPSMAIVWRKSGQSVVARHQYVNEVPVDIKFTVE